MDLCRTWNRGVLAACGAFLVGAFMTPAYANGAGGVPGRGHAQREEAPGAFYVSGGSKLVDTLNHMVMDLPPGWQAVVPRPGLMGGAITLVNYDMRALDTLPVGEEREAHSIHTVPLNAVKVDLTTFDLEGRSVEQWVQGRLEAMHAGSPDAVGIAQVPAMRSEVVAYRLAQRDGYVYRLQNEMSATYVLDLPWEGGKVLHANIGPADSHRLEEVLPILDQMRTLAQDRASRGKLHAARSGRELATPLQNLQPVIQVGDEVTVAGACTSWSGTDNGNCASGHSCAPNTPMTLYLPFYVGTKWGAGGAGSFFGNHFHGNCNWDYYAIDFNRKDANCANYIEDLGSSVYAAHNGTAYRGWQDGGYGNYIDVVASNGYKTRYAHLQSFNVAHGVGVGTQTVIGYVGASGQSGMLPHLHFGLYNGSGQSFCNRSGGCPNFEAARSPQTPKPSPMQTYNGSQAITDYGCYTAPP